VKFYFSSKDIPELAELTIRERTEKIQKAKQKLTVPEKLILNVLKLALLTPPFIYLARQDWAFLISSTILAIAINLTIIKPILFYFLKKKL